MPTLTSVLLGSLSCRGWKSAMWMSTEAQRATLVVRAEPWQNLHDIQEHITRSRCNSYGVCLSPHRHECLVVESCVQREIQCSLHGIIELVGVHQKRTNCQSVISHRAVPQLTHRWPELLYPLWHSLTDVAGQTAESIKWLIQSIHTMGCVHTGFHLCEAHPPGSPVCRLGPL